MRLCRTNVAHRWCGVAAIVIMLRTDSARFNHFMMALRLLTALPSGMSAWENHSQTAELAAAQLSSTHDSDCIG